MKLFCIWPTVFDRAECWPGAVVEAGRIEGLRLLGRTNPKFVQVADSTRPSSSSRSAFMKTHKRLKSSPAIRDHYRQAGLALGRPEADPAPPDDLADDLADGLADGLEVDETEL